MRARQARRTRRGQRGFTLVEMMIVVMIMALIATAVGMAVMHAWEVAQIKETRSDAAGLMSSGDMFRLEHGSGSCPTVDDFLAAGVVDARRRSADAWDRPFRVDCEPRGLIVRSAGPDGLFDDEDDVTSVDRP